MKKSRGSFQSLLTVLMVVTASNLWAQQAPVDSASGVTRPAGIPPVEHTAAADRPLSYERSSLGSTDSGGATGFAAPGTLPGSGPGYMTQGYAAPGYFAPGYVPGYAPSYGANYMPSGYPVSPATAGFNQPYPSPAVYAPSQMMQMQQIMRASFNDPAAPGPFPGAVPEPQYFTGGAAMGGPMGGPMAGAEGQGGCEACGNAGCKYCDCAMCGAGAGGCGCGGGGGMAAGLLGGLFSGASQLFLPYAAGGCCAPRQYDIYLDGVYLKREQASRFVEFARDVNGTALSTENLEFDPELGFRLTAAVQVYPGTSAEFTYFGLFNFATFHEERRNMVGNLMFSTYSNFGTGTVSDQADNSTFQRISYSSDLNSWEMSFRKRWVGPNCRLQGSYMMGARYVYLFEDFDYQSTGANAASLVQTGSQVTFVNTRNSMTGFQLGGDLWSCVVPGVSVGGELKAGIYGNYGNTDTDAVATNSVNVVSRSPVEIESDVDIAFLGEGRLEMIWRTSPHLTIRSGLTFMYIDGVFLAPENFITTPAPNFGVGATPRTVKKNDNGSIFYSGAHLGAEYIW